MLRRGERRNGERRRSRDGLDEEVVAGEAAVARPALGVQEAEGRPPIGRSVAVLRDPDLGPLANDLPPEPDPAASSQLEPEARPFLEGGTERGGGLGRLEDEEERTGAPGKRGEAGDLVGRAGRGPGRFVRQCWYRLPSVGARPGQVEDEDVHRPRLEKRPCHRQRLLDRSRDEDGEPLEPDAPGDGLDGVEAPGEVDPGDKGPAGLGLGGRPERECRRTARACTAESDGPGARQAAGHEEGIELGEAGRGHSVDVAARDAGGGMGRRVGRATRKRQPGPEHRLLPAGKGEE